MQQVKQQLFRRKYLIYLYVLLGALAAFPPLVTDMYLPTLPAMTAEFGTSPSGVQLSLAACIIGLAVGQLFFGPLSDKFGRRPLLKCALALFIISTLASIFAPSILLFNVCRFFQGLGGAGGVVLSRSVATDCYSGRELAKTLAIIAAINGIAPVAAPVIGGVFSEAIGWQGIFWILFGIGVALYLYSVPFRESLPKELRHKGTFMSLMKQPATLMRNRAFVCFVMVFGLSNGVLFSYISSASFILQEDFGVSEMMFGVLFAVNALGIVSGSVLSMRFRHLNMAANTGTAGMLFCSILQLINYYADGGIWGYEVLAFSMLLFVGMSFPSTTTLAMSEGRDTIGWASALVGATGFLFGAVVTPLVGLGEIRLSTFIVLTICSGLSLVIFRMRPRKTAVASEV